MKTFLTETLRRVPAGVAVRARLDSGFYGGPLLEQMEAAGVTYLYGVPNTPSIVTASAQLTDECWKRCVDKAEGEVAEFGYRLAEGRRFRRYVVKRIPIDVGEQATLDAGAYRYFVFVTNEHRHKAQVEGGVRELKSNFGLHALRKHRFMANWAWLLLVCLGHNLCCWAQQLGQLGGGRDEADLRAKRLRYRDLVVPAMMVRSGRRLTIRLPVAYPFFDRFIAALERLRRLAAAAT